LTVIIILSYINIIHKTLENDQHSLWRQVWQKKPSLQNHCQAYQWLKQYSPSCDKTSSDNDRPTNSQPMSDSRRVRVNETNWDTVGGNAFRWPVTCTQKLWRFPEFNTRLIKKVTNNSELHCIMQLKENTEKQRPPENTTTVVSRVNQ
jgi:hypothetical protein